MDPQYVADRLVEKLHEMGVKNSQLEAEVKRLEEELEPHREKLADIKDANDKLDKSRKR